MNVKTSATTPLGASNLLDAAIAILPNITKAKILSATYTWGYQESDPSVDATNGEVEERAAISCALVLSGSGPGQTTKATFEIPAPIDAMFVAAFGEGYNLVNILQADLQDWLNLYTAGFGIAGGFTLSDQQTILDPTDVSHVKGKRVHKGSRKG
jgi:hypothetical protein